MSSSQKNSLSPLRQQIKEFSELAFWRLKKCKEGRLNNDHYRDHYLSGFSFDSTFYENKKILDIGCGPRGSLEWAHMVSERIGLDPLADLYLNLGADKHLMKYVKAYAEAIPFSNNYFDIVSSFNNLDHVNDLSASCMEIKRILKPGGVFLLIVDVHSRPQLTEPQSIKWNFISSYFNDFELLEELHLQECFKNKIYRSVHAKKPIDNPKIQKGIIKAKLRKPLDY